MANELVAQISVNVYFLNPNWNLKGQNSMYISKKDFCENNASVAREGIQANNHSWTLIPESSF